MPGKSIPTNDSEPHHRIIETTTTPPTTATNDHDDDTDNSHHSDSAIHQFYDRRATRHTAPAPGLGPVIDFTTSPQIVGANIASLSSLEQTLG
jgi:hypothetical protein